MPRYTITAKIHGLVAPCREANSMTDFIEDLLEEYNATCEEYFTVDEGMLSNFHEEGGGRYSATITFQEMTYTLYAETAEEAVEHYIEDFNLQCDHLVDIRREDILSVTQQKERSL